MKGAGKSVEPAVRLNDVGVIGSAAHEGYPLLLLLFSCLLLPERNAGLRPGPRLKQTVLFSKGWKQEKKKSELLLEEAAPFVFLLHSFQLDLQDCLSRLDHTRRTKNSLWTRRPWPACRRHWCC